jgi:DNA-binding transcriptional regulator YiaG
VLAVRRKYVPSDIQNAPLLGPERLRKVNELLLNSLMAIAKEPPEKAAQSLQNLLRQIPDVMGNPLFLAAFSVGMKHAIDDQRAEKGEASLEENDVLSAEELQIILAASKITKGDLARHLGISPASITRWTQGKEKIPRHHVAAIRRYTSNAISQAA